MTNVSLFEAPMKASGTPALPEKGRRLVRRRTPPPRKGPRHASHNDHP